MKPKYILAALLISGVAAPALAKTDSLPIGRCGNRFSFCHVIPLWCLDRTGDTRSPAPV